MKRVRFAVFCLVSAAAGLGPVGVPMGAFAQSMEQDSAIQQTATPILSMVSFSLTGKSNAKGPDGKSANAFLPRDAKYLFPIPDLASETRFDGTFDDAYGAYQRGLYKTAMELAVARAKTGDSAAQTLVASLLANGQGVKRDPATAAFWYSQAAANGDPSAMYEYALLLMEGGIVPRDKAKSDALMQAAAEAGQPYAAFNWAQVLVASKPGTEGLTAALPFYEVAATQGVADAQYAVSQIYVNLPGLPPEKRSKARQWLARAATAGFDTAQFDLAVWLINGVEGPRDYQSGFKWMQLAASHGNVVAQNKLAHLYINAIGTEPDPVEAAKWYVLSRRAGLKDIELEDFFLGIEDEQQRQAIEEADNYNRF
jgi:uncharacterized protein